MKKKILAIVLTVILTVSVIPFGMFAASAATAWTECTEVAFGRDALSKMENGTNLVKAYDAINAAVATHKMTGGGLSDVVDISDCGLYLKDFDAAFWAYRNDVPEHYWLNSYYKYAIIVSTSDDQNDPELALKYPINSVQLFYNMNNSQIAAAQSKVTAAVNAYISGIKSTTKVDAACELHDLIASKVTYSETEHAHDLYGAAVEEKAVCDGYSRLYQLLLRKIGLQSFVVRGEGKDKESQWIGHAWNYVHMPNGWVQTDVTWDDQDKTETDDAEIFHLYYACTDTQINAHHRVPSDLETPYALPECNTQSYRYFSSEKGNDMGSALNYNNILNMLCQNVSEDGYSAHCEFIYNGNENLGDWVADNFIGDEGELIYNSGHYIFDTEDAIGMSYSYIRYENEYHLRIDLTTLLLLADYKTDQRTYAVWYTMFEDVEAKKIDLTVETAFEDDEPTDMWDCSLVNSGGKTINDAPWGNLPTNVVINDTITGIGKNAFYGCEVLREVEIGTGVKNIGQNAFAGCNALKKVVIYSQNAVLDVAGIPKTAAIYGIKGSQTEANAVKNGYTFYPLVDSIKIVSFPNGREYGLNESFDAAGLSLEVKYTFGGTVKLTSGFEVTGFDSSTPGTKLVYAGFGDQTVSFTVKVLGHKTNPTAVDMSNLAKMILKTAALDLSLDMNDDGLLNLKDLLLIKKCLAK